MHLKDIINRREFPILIVCVGVGILLIALSAFLFVDSKPLQTESGSNPESSDTSSSVNDSDPTSTIENGTTGKNSNTSGKSGTSTSKKNPTSGSNTTVKAPEKLNFTWPKADKRVTAKIQSVNNVPRMYINGVQLPPLMFFGNTDMSARYSIIADQVRKVAKSNMHLYSVISSPELNSNQPDEIKYFKLQNDLDVVIDNDPNAFILLRVNVGKYYNTGDYPSSEIVKYATKRADHLNMVSISSKRWLSEAKKMLEDLVKYIRSHPVYSKHVFGYHIECGEWFQYMFRENGLDISESNSSRFREWLRNKYKTDAALQSAWSDKSVTLANAKVPTDLPGNISFKPEEYTLMLKSSDRKYIDYLDYIGSLVSDIIAELSTTVKNVSNRENIVIAFYGYLFELADPQSGHFGLDKLLAHKDIDGFASPECYLDRNVNELFPNQPAGSTGAYMSAVDSIQRAGKMWFVESDQRTFINRANASTEHDSYLVPAKSVWEVQELAKRDVGWNMLRGSAIWFMDLWSVGWLDDQDIWNNNSRLGDLYYAYAQSQKSMSKLDVAFVVDEQSQSLVAQPTDSAWHFLSYQRYDFYRAGISFGMYTTKDLLENKIPDAKVIFMLNPFRLNDEKVNKILSAAKGKTLVFSYGFGETSAANIKKLTGMDIARVDGKYSVKLTGLDGAKKFGLSSGSTYGADVAANPRWAVTGGSDIQIAKYGDGKIGFAAKNLGTHKAVFFGGMRMSTEVIRAIMNYSGTHVFSDSDDVYMANENLVVMHSSKKGVKTIKFPTKTDVYDYFKGEWYTNVTSIKINAEIGETRYFFYGKKSDIEAMKLPKW